MEVSGKKPFQQTADEIFTSYKTEISGLSPVEVLKRQNLYGPNTLSSKKRASPFKIFLSQFVNPLVILLLIAGLVSFLLSEHLDAVFITFIVLINAVIGFVQEYKAENTIQALKKLLSPKSLVTRDGVQVEIESAELVAGDIVTLTAGNIVPADLRLVTVDNARVDESTLTGESTPVEKNLHNIKENVQVADQTNMAFAGTTIVGGKAVGVVVAIGNNTFLGTIASETTMAKEGKPPLVKKFSAFARSIGIIVVVSTAGIAVLQLMLGEEVRIIFKTAVGIAVAAIPEGLPIIATIALSLAVQRMGKKKAIIRHLPAAETLGSTTVICTDKTGTLTLNQMKVVKMFDGKEEYRPHVKFDTKNRPLTDLLRCGYACTEAPELHLEGDTPIHVDPTESAVVRTSLKTGVSKEELASIRYLDILPFQNEKRMMAALVQMKGKKKLYVKGSPEKIFSICGLQNDTFLNEKVEEYARNGLRVIACAEKDVRSQATSISDSNLESGYTFLGLFAIIDPPREDVKSAIGMCQKAGIRVVMITGDHPVTAMAIASELGMSNDEDKVITGHEMLSMSDENLRIALRDARVFARVTPDQKLRIVEAFKNAGEIVAVTGDGVNDAPALRAAHIGIAMGMRGTDVAKEASHMVILDDSFSTIVKAIREARILFENIRKATFFLLPTGFSVIMTILVAIFLGYPIPFTAIQLLWVNLVTNGLQDISLAFEPEEKGTLQRKPRSPREGIMSALLYRRAVLVAITITVGVVIMYSSAIESGMPVEAARTVALSTMIIFQFFQLFNSRSETSSIFKMNPFGNRLLLVAMGVASIAFIASFTVPGLKTILTTTAIPFTTLLQATFMAFSVIVVVEIDKVFSRKK